MEQLMERELKERIERERKNLYKSILEKGLLGSLEESVRFDEINEEYIELQKLKRRY